MFETEPEEQQELIDAITAEVDRWISDLPGFVTSTFHASLDGTWVVNYAQWDSQADLERFANHDEWSVLNKTVADLGFEEFGDSLFCRRLLISLSCCWRVEAGKGTASAVPDTNDSARRVWFGTGRSDPAGTGSLP